ncbi:DNA-binding response regulator [Paenibacillus chitinolyticus]|uniref:DNA-binding response regulator n=1 Tax=Paenibacillus chitinolyticus TaxID=79263 RepID=A0A410WVR3_9BACL|nr:response regulator transcription factor [Paenibacillus chitinolyticus]MCY9589241.1 response regulator transcription factor [Paenibacillus chitinolyticus]MCY9594314.1 response regulator transcription factor [Paenibacillus chitinolyticus]QAV18434.1 DNA-binding response regulator [Paenibacillus chitinolyticus]
MKKILIIEDEATIAQLHRDYLNLHGFQVEISTRGDDGLNKALTEGFDLIVLDLMLPGKDGFEVCRQIRMAMEVPILIVSARKDEFDKIRGLGMGADDYMTKPFSPGELVARVKAHLTRYERLVGLKETAPGEIRIRDLAIEPESRRVYIRGKEVPLPAREFDLLLFLARHPNRVFRKEEIFEKIWGMDSMGDIATVTVHVRRIREKIEADPSAPEYIETIWGVGYRFSG